MVCAVGAALQAKYHRLAALMLIGGAGLVTCITFVWLSAPDLALTQLLVEIVTTVLILLGLRWLPKRSEDRRDADASRRGCAACATSRSPSSAGAGMAILAYAVMTQPVPDSIANFFLENAYTRRRRHATSSTSSSSISAASTRWAKSPCSASSR